LLAHDDAELPDVAQRAFAADCRRRADDVPLAYLVGEREFYGLALKVTPAVLVPRADTETLVDWALQVLGDGLAGRSAPRVIDLGTGSGAIALAIKKRWPSGIVCACDSSAAALDVARLNAHTLGLDVEFALSDWWAALASRRFDLVVGNPPYIAGNDLHLQALRHEPTVALSPGTGGLEAIDCIIEGAPQHLLPLGWLMLEHGHDQADAVCQRLRRAGFVAVQSRTDLAGHRRCSAGRLNRVATGT
ncbi:MAG: peptide chain release factor N(5)-glutamine methyltransferase, partial [Rubrivivax sp.]